MNRVIILNKMTKNEDTENPGVTFSGTAFRSHLKYPIYVLANHNSTSLDVNEFQIDITSPEKEENFSVFISEQNISKNVAKLMKLPLASEPNNLIFVELLHSKGKFFL